MHQKEKEFADLLTKQGKKWLYEPKTFLMPYPYARFIPDFYIPQEDTYYEVVKNYSVFKQKQLRIGIFRLSYPEIKYKVVYPNGEYLKVKIAFEEKDVFS